MWRHGISMWEAIQRAGWLDALDILIVAGFIYIVLVWFQRRTTRLAVLGIAMLGSVYVLAKYFGLFLTTAIFQAFFAIFLIALVVIFQEELRHFFERLAVVGWERRVRHRPAEPAEPLGVVLRTVADLARQRIGALIVIRGRDPIGRHLEGGTELHGEPSEALFKSLFDPHSPGHDGAVVIDGTRVEGFAYYLPLSKDIKQTANVGTRHAAALGLAELTDACCIVVSEERGEISVAIDGRLQHTLSLDALTALLQQFFAQRFPPSGRQAGVLRWVREHTREKVIAAVLAVGVWVAFAHQTEVVRRDITVPIEFRNLASTLVIDEPHPRMVTVTLSGEERAFRTFDPSSLRVSLDLSKAQAGPQIVAVAEHHQLRVPNDLSIVRLEPAEIVLRILPAPAAHRE